MSTKIEPIVILMTGLVLTFTILLIFVAKTMSSDGQTFQIIAGLVTGFSGALLMRVKPRASVVEDNGDSTVTVKSTIAKEIYSEPKK